MSQQDLRRKKDGGCLINGCFSLIVFLGIMFFIVFLSQFIPSDSPSRPPTTPTPVPANMTTADYIQYAAGRVYGKDLIEAKYVEESGYIFLKARYESSSGDGIIYSTERHAESMLKMLRSYLDEDRIDFKEVNFESFTNLIDVYGNIHEDSVLSFWITRETVKRINFENFWRGDMKHVSNDWYQHPALSK